MSKAAPSAAELEEAYLAVRDEVMGPTRRSVHTLSPEQLAGLLLRVSGGIKEAVRSGRFIAANAIACRGQWKQALRLIEALGRY
jgi:hypothetical protein